MDYLTLEKKSGLVDGFWRSKELANEQAKYLQQFYFKNEREFVVITKEQFGRNYIRGEDLICNADWYREYFYSDFQH